jgi:hypothetical protein
MASQFGSFVSLVLDEQRAPNAKPMKKPAKRGTSRRGTAAKGRHEPPAALDELLPEYDPALIREGVRGKYAADFAESSNVVVLDPDVARQFPNTIAVNEALRGLARLIQSHERRSRASSRRTA